MVGPTLIDIREHIEALATGDGQYYLRCGRTGDRPVPAAGNRFPNRPTARAAARATEQYRSALRRYDPQVPYYDLIVCEEKRRDLEGQASEESEYQLSVPVVTARSTVEQRTLTEFCHRVAGAVFETLSDGSYGGVETAVMDAYFELAETVDDPDKLCLRLLESMATELDEQLSTADQSEVIAGAADRLEPADGANHPLDATLATLDQRGLIESYTRSSCPVDLRGRPESIVVQISGYALSARDGRLPVLPLTFELCRHHTGRPRRSVQADTVDDGWRLRFDPADTAEQDGLLCAPIDRGV